MTGIEISATCRCDQGMSDRLVWLARASLCTCNRRKGSGSQAELIAKLKRDGIIAALAQGEVANYITTLRKMTA